MIIMNSPSLAFNSHDVPGPEYGMDTTIRGTSGSTTAQLVALILGAQAGAVGNGFRSLSNLVINCHGIDGGGGLVIGERVADLNNNNVALLSALKPLSIGCIWLVACQAANGPMGKRLCQAISHYANAQVVASDEDQRTGIWGSWRLVTTRQEVAARPIPPHCRHETNRLHKRIVVQVCAISNLLVVRVYPAFFHSEDHAASYEC